MALVVKLDLIGGCRIEQTLTSIRAYRVGMVKGFADPDHPNLSIWEAHNAAGIPVIGDSWPGLTGGPAILRTKFSTPLSDDLAMITMVYDWQILPSSYLKSYRASLIQRTVNYDKDGNPAKITYTPKLGARAGSFTADLTLYSPQATLNIQKLENFDPESISILLGGVNTTAWRGYPPRTWMFFALDGSSNDNVQYENLYGFLHNPLTWDQFEVYRDELGRVPPYVASGGNIDFSGGTTSGNGWKRFKVQKEIEFNTTFSWI